MQRSGSSSRGLEEFFTSGGATAAQRAALEMDQLPTYDPLSELAKKEASKAKSAENAVHAIPFVLILCAVILWFFSSPQSRI